MDTREETEGELQLVNKAIDNAGTDPWMGPREWREQNPNSNWKDYYKKYDPSYSDEKGNWPNYEKYKDGSNGYDWFFFDKKKFKDIFPERPDEDYQAFRDRWSNEPHETYEDYVNDLRKGVAPLPKSEWLKQHPAPWIEPHEQEEFERLLTPDELSAYRKGQLNRKFDGATDQGLWGDDIDEERLTRRAQQEFFRRHPEKLLPKLPETPEPRDWPPDFQGF